MQWFEQEKKLAHDEGVSHPDNFPFFLVPEDPNGQALLLIHGFSAAPREMLSLGKFLQKNNFTVYGTRLPGHGTQPEDLLNRKAEEWQETVSRGYQSLLKMDLNVSVAGSSTGALLALTLALEQQPDKLILLSPFLRLKHILAPFAGLLSYLISYQDKTIPEAESPFYYQRRPLKGIAQINRLCKQLHGHLGEITTPSLILTSTGDATIAAGTAAVIFHQLGSSNKKLHRYGDEVPHVLTTSENPLRDDVFQRCISFLNSST
ncbi:MAG: alpha/beta fold hydrolase [Desulfuromusa sp.]|nr:alpha/beta fold hydrolase [Desulfuromusa sp.]